MRVRTEEWHDREIDNRVAKNLRTTDDVDHSDEWQDHDLWKTEKNSVPDTVNHVLTEDTDHVDRVGVATQPRVRRVRSSTKSTQMAPTPGVDGRLPMCCTRGWVRRK